MNESVNKSRELKPCPVCRAHPKKNQCIAEMQIFYRISCPECETTTKRYPTKWQAIEAWNERVIL